MPVGTFFALDGSVMKTNRHHRGSVDTVCREYGNSDVAILFLRIFTGGIVLLHNVGKLQVYDQIIDSYPPMLFNSPQATFAVFALLESIFAVMIIIGLRLRFAAFVMALGMLLSIFVVIPRSGMEAGVLQFVYMGIYIFFVLSGGGCYSFDCGRRGVETGADGEF